MRRTPGLRVPREGLSLGREEPVLLVVDRCFWVVFLRQKIKSYAGE